MPGLILRRLMNATAAGSVYFAIWPKSPAIQVAFIPALIWVMSGAFMGLSFCAARASLRRRELERGIGGLWPGVGLDAVARGALEDRRRGDRLQGHRARGAALQDASMHRGGADAAVGRIDGAAVEARRGAQRRGGGGGRASPGGARRLCRAI